MPPKAKAKKSETSANPGKVILMPRPNIPIVEVAHPTSLPSFLVASSLFLLASHSKCNLVPATPSTTRSQSSPPAAATADGTATVISSPRGRSGTPTKGTKNAQVSNQVVGVAPSSPSKVLPGGGSKIKDGDRNNNNNAVDIHSAIPQLKSTAGAAGWNLEVSKKSIFLCDALIGDLEAGGGGGGGGSQTQEQRSSEAFFPRHRPNPTESCSMVASASGDNNNSNNNIDFDKLSSFFAASSGHHGLVVVRDDKNRQRVFAGGMNEEGQLPLPIKVECMNNTNTSIDVDAGVKTKTLVALPKRTSSTASVVADTNAVPFSELKNLEFKLFAGVGGEGQQQQQQQKQQVAESSINVNSASTSTTGAGKILRPSEGALVVAAACGSAHTVVLVRNNTNNSNSNSNNSNSNNNNNNNNNSNNNCGISSSSSSIPQRFRSSQVARRRALMNFDSWQPNPITYLFGCGRKEAIGEFTLPPGAPSISATARTTSTTAATPLERFLEENSPRRAVPPEENSFRHLAVGDGEDFDALWAYGDLTFARGRRGLVCFGTITAAAAAATSSQQKAGSAGICAASSTLKYHSPTQAQVVIAAPLGCLVKEVIVLNPVANRPRAIYVFVEDNNVVAANQQSQSSRSFQQQQQQQSASGGSNVIDAIDELDRGRRRRSCVTATGVSSASRTVSNTTDNSGYYYYNPSSYAANNFSNNNNGSSSSSSSPAATAKTLFDATRLLEIHIAFPSGHGGDLKMLHPPPPIFSYADVTNKIFGAVATTLRRMGAPLFRLKKIACGSEHAVGVTVDGAVIGFGSNYFGQLGETAGGSDQGPKFADESQVGPRTARMYPSPDCSSVAPKLHRQYYESAILLRPPSLKRSPLIIAQAYAQHKGRTVEFNDVVSVVPIPDRLQQLLVGPGSAANSAVRLSPSSSPGGAYDGYADDEDEDNADRRNSPSNDNAAGDDDDDDEDAYDDSAGGRSFENYSSPTSVNALSASSSSSSTLKRKGTAAPKSMSLAAAAASASRKAVLAQLASEQARDQQQVQGKDDADSEASKVARDRAIRAVMNPSWPVDTVVDCCCGPLYTALMQANAELLFMGDLVPSHLQQQQQQHQQQPESSSSSQQQQQLCQQGQAATTPGSALNFSSPNSRGVDREFQRSYTPPARLGGIAGLR